MKKISVFVEPFVMNQRFLINDDNGVLAEENAYLDNLAANIIQACKIYNVNKIDIYGPTGYTEKIGADIGSVAYQYELSNLDITYM